MLDFKAAQAYLERLYSFNEMVAKNPFQLHKWEVEGVYLYNNGEYTYTILEHDQPVVSPRIIGFGIVIIEIRGLWSVDINRDGVDIIFYSLADAVNAIPSPN
jgi:hypothetical protein